MPTTLKSDKTKEIQQVKDEQFVTRRATAFSLEEILYEPLPVLDHGFVRVIDYMGVKQDRRA